ncbi:reverse transcriptase domain-containing protein [Tanacetum coccineum]
MAINSTMAPITRRTQRGYEDAIVVPEITANNLRSRHGYLIFVQNSNFLRAPDLAEKEPPRSILTWDDLVSKFINKFFPPSKTTNLRNEITRFQQKFDETFYEAWDRFNDLLRGCPHHGFSELHQLDTFYNALNSNDQIMNSVAGGNFLDKMPRECLKIIESKSKVRQSRSKAIVSKVSTNSSTPAVSSDVAELKDMVRALILDKKNQTPAPAPVKAVEQSCVTCGGGHSYQNCPATDGNVYRDNIQDDFIMEEIDEFLEHDDSIPPGVEGIYGSDGDTAYLEELLSVINNDPNLPPSPVCEINVPEEMKSSCEDPPDLELKDLPSHLEYAFLEGDDKLPVIIAKNLKDEDNVTPRNFRYFKLLFYPLTFWVRLDF